MDTSLHGTVGCGSGYSICIGRDGSAWIFGEMKIYGFGEKQNETNFSPLKIKEIENADIVSSGDYHSAIIDYDKNVWTFGRGTNGCLGHGNKNSTSIPTKISSLANITSVSCGGSHTICIDSDHNTWGFGENHRGQLGVGNCIGHQSPVIIDSLMGNVTNTSCGFNHTLFLTLEGTVYGTGGNEFGQAGQIHGKDSLIPFIIPELSDIVSVSCGYYFSMALDEYGRIFSFGKEQFIGRPATGTVDIIQCLEHLADKICCGPCHALCIDLEGELWGWGNNMNSQLGLPSRDCVYEPTCIPGLDHAIDVETGSRHTIVKNDHGKIWSFGSGFEGALGFGNAENHPTPTLLPRKYTDLLGYTVSQVKSAKKSN